MKLRRFKRSSNLGAYTRAGGGSGRIMIMVTGVTAGHSSVACRNQVPRCPSEQTALSALGGVMASH